MVMSEVLFRSGLKLRQQPNFLYLEALLCPLTEPHCLSPYSQPALLAESSSQERNKQEPQCINPITCNIPITGHTQTCATTAKREESAMPESEHNKKGTLPPVSVANH